MPKQIKEKYKEFGEEGTYSTYVALVTLLPLVININIDNPVDTQCTS